jgi:hypothetical protein
VVSGSGLRSGYLYFADRSSLKIEKVLTPVVSDFNHIGVIQVTDDILGAGYERFESGAAGTSVVLFYDVRNAASPATLDHLTIERTSAEETAGAVGLCRDGFSWLFSWRTGIQIDSIFTATTAMIFWRRRYVLLPWEPGSLA